MKILFRHKGGGYNPYLLHHEFAIFFKVSDTFPDNNGEGDAEFHLGTAQHHPVLGLQVRNRPDIQFVSGTENISD